MHGRTLIWVMAAVLLAVTPMLQPTLLPEARAASLAWSPTPILVAKPGDTLRYDVNLSYNSEAGEGRVASFALSVEGLPQGWGWAFYLGERRVAEVAVAAGGEETVELVVSVPSDAEQREYSFAFTAADRTLGETVSAELGISVIPPVRRITLVTRYPSVGMGGGDTARVKVNATNGGDVDEIVDFALSKPPGWSVRLAAFAYNITSAYLVAGTTTDLDIVIQPGAEATGGVYTVGLTASTRDGARSSTVSVTVEYTAEAVVGGQPLLSTRYQVLQGPSDSTFEFKLDLSNKGENRTFSLLALAPQGWTGGFKPEFERKYISTISLQAGETRGVTLEVTPPPLVAPGNYTLLVEARSADVRPSLELKVQITGTYKLQVTTPTGTLNAAATAGEESITAILVQNTGTAKIDSIRLSTSKPSGWSVALSPDRLVELGPNEQQEVEVKMRPPANAIPGDYVVTVSASSQRAVDDVELRVSVSTTTIWGWVGIGVVAAVFVGLFFIFLKVGRR